MACTGTPKPRWSICRRSERHPVAAAGCRRGASQSTARLTDARLKIAGVADTALARAAVARTVAGCPANGLQVLNRLAPRTLQAAPRSPPPSAAITSGGACTSSISTPSPPSGNCSLPLGWMKVMSWPAAPLRMPPGAKRTPRAVIHATAWSRSSTHRPTWLSGVVCTAGFLSGSIGCIRSTSTAVGPLPSAQMSSSTFSRSETKVLLTVRPSMSTHRLFNLALSGPPMAICWMPRMRKGFFALMDAPFRQKQGWAGPRPGFRPWPPARP